ncbi:MAG: ABC transporter permease [Candidatus Acidiferrales bacterium]
MQTLLQDLRYGWRMLVKSPGFTAVAVLTLALGIGANSAIFSIVYCTILRPLPFPDSKQLTMIWETDANRALTRGAASPAEFLDWREQNHVFERIASWRTWFYTLTGQGEPEQVWGVSTSAEFFQLIGAHPILGRDFLQEEETPGHEQVVILSYGLWQRRYGGDPAVIGRSIVIDEKPYTVIGVLPAGFSVFGTSRQFDLWMPFAFDRARLNRDDHSVLVFARLKKDVTLAQAQAEMGTILRRLQQQYPTNDEGIGIRVSRMQQEPVRDLLPAMSVLTAAVGLVLFIACANVANLLLARASTREREIAVRAALGAGRKRIIRQLLTESFLLAFLGGGLGLLAAYGGLRLLPIVLPPRGGFGELPRMQEIGIDHTVVGFTVLIACLTGILFGLAPAFQVSQTSLSETLKEGSRGATGARRGHMLRSALVVSEVAFSLLLLLGAGLLIRSFVRLMTEDIGFNPQNLLTMQVWLPESHYAEGRPIISFYERALQQVRGLPGVISASATNFLPMTGWADFCDFDIQGRPAPPPGKEFTSEYLVVDPDYVRTMGIPLKEGRDLMPRDGEQSGGVVLINEALVNRYWPNDDPVGKLVRIQLPETNTPWRPKPREGWLTIVGVVGDVRDWAWSEKRTGQIYLPYQQNPSRLMRLVVRTPADRAVTSSAVRRALMEVDANQPATEIRTMEELVTSAVARRRLSMLLLAIFAGFATLLAAVGIYGVMSYAVTQRTHEIGVRMALGAQPRDVLGMVVREGMFLTLTGVAFGFLASLLSARLIRGLLYGVSALDPVTVFGVAGFLAAVALISCFFPARRATKVDPMVALRYE